MAAREAEAGALSGAQGGRAGKLESERRMAAELKLGQARASLEALRLADREGDRAAMVRAFELAAAAAKAVDAVLAADE